MSVKDIPEQPASANRGWFQRCVRALLPRYWHMSGKKQGYKIEYWKGDERFRNSLHFSWNWMGRGHWLVIFLPEVP